MKNKKIVMITFILSIVYIVSSLTKVGVFGACFGGFDYRIFTSAVLLYSCFGCVKSIKTSHAQELLLGTFGVILLVINELYNFVYEFLYQGSLADITISYFSRSSVYLFFIPVILMYAPLPDKIKNVAKKSVSVLSVILTLFIIFAVLIGHSFFLGIPSIMLALLCLFFALYLLIQSYKDSRLKDVRLFVSSMIASSSADVINHLSELFQEDLRLSFLIIAFSPIIYLLIGLGVQRLKKVDDNF